jgi:sugar phosphate permease
MHFTFGSWYKSNEIARRGTFWYSAQNVGTLTAGLLQAAASSNLDGVCGLAGWRWLFIICAIITIPIGIIGFFVLPGTPDRPNRLVLKRRDIDLAVKRLSHAGHDTSDRLRLSTVGKVFTDKRTWAFLLLDVAFWNASLNIISGGFLLWLKSLKRYSPAKINSLGSISPALGILYNLLVGVISDLYLGPAWAITIAHTWNIIGLVILVIWHVPESALWFAFMTTYSANCISSVLYGWVNSSLRHSPAERGFTIVLINILAQSTVAWTPLLVFKTVEAPRFLKGYSYVLANALCFICLAHLVRSYLRKR